MRVRNEPSRSATLRFAVPTFLGSSAEDLAVSATTPEQQRANAAAVTTARVDVWSTDPLRAHERLAYWREAVCRSVFGISIEAPPERFSAWITARSTGGLRFATSESTRYQLQRTRRDI